MDFDIHPSRVLQQLFQDKPYQGQDPEKATVIVLGIDANFGEEIDRHDGFFRFMTEYLRDGVAFWEKYGAHHPFLMYERPDLLPPPEFPLRRTGDGVPYHRNFAKLDLTPADRYAPYVSFVELLNVPTIGSVKTNDQRRRWWELFEDYTAIGHCLRINDLVMDSTGHKRLILLCDQAVRKMSEIKRRYGVFEWIGDASPNGPTIHPNKSAHVEIRKIPHFSSAYIFAQIGPIRSLIKRFCPGSQSG